MGIEWHCKPFKYLGFQLGQLSGWKTHNNGVWAASMTMLLPTSDVTDGTQGKPSSGLIKPQYRSDGFMITVTDFFRMFLETSKMYLWVALLMRRPVLCKDCLAAVPLFPKVSRFKSAADRNPGNPTSHTLEKNGFFGCSGPSPVGMLSVWLTRALLWLRPMPGINQPIQSDHFKGSQPLHRHHFSAPIDVRYFIFKRRKATQALSQRTGGAYLLLFETNTFTHTYAHAHTLIQKHIIRRSSKPYTINASTRAKIDPSQFPREAACSGADASKAWQRKEDTSKILPVFRDNFPRYSQRGYQVTNKPFLTG